jgi:hypothetical protein
MACLLVASHFQQYVIEIMLFPGLLLKLGNEGTLLFIKSMDNFQLLRRTQLVDERAIEEKS